MLRRTIARQSRYQALLNRLFSNKGYHVSINYQTRYIHTGSLHQQQKITKLEHLNKVDNLEDIDLQLIKKLIDEKTDSLNAENELKMLKQLDQEQRMIRKNTLKPFIRPAWILFLMSSTVYMGWQFYWWYCEYNRREDELQQEINSLEEQLQKLLDAKSNMKEDVTQPWYKRYLWF